MPRRHPEPEEKKTVDPVREKERRERRQRKRLNKSPRSTGGILTFDEIFVIKTELATVKRQIKSSPEDKMLRNKKRNLQSELDRHEESLKPTKLEW